MDRLTRVIRETLDLLTDEHHAKIAEIKDREDRLHETGVPLEPDPRWFPTVAVHRCAECEVELPDWRSDDLCGGCRNDRMNRMRERLGLPPRKERRQARRSFA